MHIERSSPREPSAQTKRRSSADQPHMRRRPSAHLAQINRRLCARELQTMQPLLQQSKKSSTGSLAGGIEKSGPSRDPRQSFSRVKAGPVRLAYRKKQPQGALSADQAQTRRRGGADQAQINQRKCSQCFSDRNKQ